jgi:GST-like protein
VGDELTIADIAWFPWVVCLDKYYNAADVVGLSSYTNVERWRKEIASMKAVEKGMKINNSMEDGGKYLNYSSEE